MIRLGALLTLIGGCAVGPDFKSPDAPAPKTWNLANDPRVEANKKTEALWWRAFNDATLNRLVEAGSDLNLGLQLAGIRIVEARAQLALATGKQYPQSQAAFGNAKVVGLSENISRIGNIPRNYASYQVGFDAAWELDFWGKFRRGVEAEIANVMASTADYYSALVSLTAEIARTYVVIRTNEVLVLQAEENVRIQEEALAIAESRFKNGATSELDPTQAKTLLESTRATIPQRQTALQQARNALSSLLGQPPGNVEALLVGPKDIPRAPAKVAVGVPAEVLRRRPDVRAAELLAAAQSARIGVAKAELYPSFSIVGTVGLDASTRGTASPNLFRSDALYYTVGPQVNWTFLDYARRKNAVRIQDARFQELLVNYRNVVIKAAQEVEDALVGFLNAQQEAAFEENAVASAERSVQLSLVAYREGEVDYQRVLEAQRALLTQQTSLADARSRIATNLIAVYKALGGGWQLHEETPVVPDSTKREMKERTNWGDLLEEPRTKTKNP